MNDTPYDYVNNIREFGNPAYGYNPIQIDNGYLGASIFMKVPWYNITTVYGVFGVPTVLPFQMGNTQVLINLLTDFGIDYSYTIEYLLQQGLNTIFFAGQDDTNLNINGMWSLVNNLNWVDIRSFRNSQFQSWVAPNGTVIGNFKQYENLKAVSVWKSGHLGSFDQPASIYQLLDNFINDNFGYSS
jgi:carboxypeptidase C (cathepsin A)